MWHAVLSVCIFLQSSIQLVPGFWLLCPVNENQVVNLNNCCWLCRLGTASSLISHFTWSQNEMPYNGPQNYTTSSPMDLSFHHSGHTGLLNSLLFFDSLPFVGSSSPWYHLANSLTSCLCLPPTLITPCSLLPIPQLCSFFSLILIIFRHWI